MTDLSLLNYISEYPIDNCIGVYDGVFSIPTALSTNNATIETGFTNSPLFLGLFNPQSTNIWVPTSRYYMFNDGAGFPTGYGIRVRSKNGDILLQSTNNSTSVSATVNYKIFAFAQKNQGIIDLPLETPAADQLLYFDSRKNYRKVAFDEVIPFTINAAPAPDVYTETTFTFNHNLGYIPKSLAFIEEGGEIMDAAMWASSPIFCYPWIIRPTTTSFIIRFINSATTAHNINVHLRIYYD